jgi:hypothetical protein
MSVSFGPGLTRLMIGTELSRRLALGVEVDLGGGLIFTVQIDEDSQGRIGNLALAATRAQMTATPFSTPFRDKNNVGHVLNAAQMIDLAEQALARVTALREASWALKDADPPPALHVIPDNANWPA